MALKKFNPTTPGQRNLVLVDKGDLYKGKPVKKLTQGLTKSGVRNNSGHVTAWHRGGGHKRRYRMIDFKRTKTGMMATVERLEYDPNRTAFIALITYEDGEQSYILAPQRLAVGDKVMSGDGADIIEALTSLRAVSYELRDPRIVEPDPYRDALAHDLMSMGMAPPSPKRRQIGFLAQDVLDVFPDLDLKSSKP